MDVDAIITVGVIIYAIILFATEYFSVDVVAVSLIVILVATGVITPAEGVKGFANNATVTVAAMFVLSAALIKTGIIETVAPRLSRLIEKGYKRSVAVMMVAVGSVSAFINNTPVVATLIPIVSNAAQKAEKNPSKYLIPLSFGAIFGGTCTLIGTSTNLLVSGIAEENGLSPFSMFLMAPFGLILSGVGMLYLLTVGRKLIPESETGKPLTESYGVHNYLTEIELVPGSGLSGSTIGKAFLENELDIDILQVKRGGQFIDNPKEDFELTEGDRLIIRGDIDKFKEVIRREELCFSPSLPTSTLEQENTVLLEVVVLNNSALEGKNLAEFNFSEKYRANVLAIRQRGKLKHTSFKNLKLQPGDMLLLQTSRSGYDEIRQLESSRDAPFTSIHETAIKGIQKKNLVVVGITLAAVILLATTNLLSIMIGALAGIVVLNIFGVIRMQEAYEAIDWKVVFLLAGALSLGTAMQASGVADSLAGFLIYFVGEKYGPVALVSALYLLTSILTEIMSNNASVALLAPIAISIAGSIGIDPLPLLLAITFAGSASFMTPVGYQTNTMIYSAGNYHFFDFMKVGGPLNLLFWLLATLLIPLIYPF